MTPIHRRMTAADWGLLVALSALWGGSFYFNQVAVAELPPLTVAAVRVALAAAALWATMLAIGVRMPCRPAVLGAFFGMGLLNNAVPFTLIVWSQTQIASGVAAILNSTTPLFTVLLAHVLTRDERLTPARLAGVIVGFLGVAVMMCGAVLGGSGLVLLAQAACLAGAVSYALASLWGRRFRTLGVPPLAAAAGQLSASSLILLPLAALVGAERGGDRALAASPSCRPRWPMWSISLARAGATNLMQVTLLIPATAILLGVGILGEARLPRHLAGMALIGLGLAAIDGRMSTLLRRRPAA